VNSLREILNVWQAGGWCMIPLALTALAIYAIGLQILLYLFRRQYKSVPQSVWSDWIKNPHTGQGEVGEIIRYTQQDARSLADIQNRFAEIRSAKLPAIDRRLSVLYVLIKAAPLLGLLGTVLGMIKTFAAISRGGGQLVERISTGIAEALITTETGLLIAVPGVFLAYIVRRKRNEYEAFLAQLESATMQHVQRTLA
jgi:biopolymer transport protein ExbB